MPRRPKVKVEPDARKARLSVRISVKALERLGVICSMEHTRPGALVEQLILERGKRWVVQDRAREAGESGVGSGESANSDSLLPIPYSPGKRAVS